MQYKEDTSNHQRCHNRGGSELPIPGSVQAEATGLPVMDIVK